MLIQTFQRFRQCLNTMFIDFGLQSLLASIWKNHSNFEWDKNTNMNLILYYTVSTILDMNKTNACYSW